MDLGDVRNSTATAHIHGRGSLPSTAEPDAMPYLGAALPVGIVGAAAVAVFTLVLDSLAGRPLATPSALGATILFGAEFDLGAPIQSASVFGYTLMHGALFVIAAAGAVSAEFTLSKQGMPLGIQFSYGFAGLFLGLLLSISGLLWMAGIPLTPEFGMGRLAASNAVAAVAMATMVYRRATARHEADAR